MNNTKSKYERTEQGDWFMVHGEHRMKITQIMVELSLEVGYQVGLADSQKRVEGIFREIEDTLDLHEDESGWISISNHADYSQWQALKSREGVNK